MKKVGIFLGVLGVAGLGFGIYLYMVELPKAEAARATITERRIKLPEGTQAQVQETLSQEIVKLSAGLARSPENSALISFLKKYHGKNLSDESVQRFRDDLGLLLGKYPTLAPTVASYFILESNPDLLFATANCLARYRDDHQVKALMLQQITEGDNAHKASALTCFIGSADPSVIEPAIIQFENNKDAAVHLAAATVLSDVPEGLSAQQKERIGAIARNQILSGESLEFKTNAIRVLEAVGPQESDIAILRNIVETTGDKTVAERNYKMQALKTIVEYKRLNNPDIDRVLSENPQSDEDLKKFDSITKQVLERLGD